MFFCARVHLFWIFQTSTMITAYTLMKFVNRIRHLFGGTFVLCLLLILVLFIYESNYTIKNVYHLSSYVKNFQWVSKYPKTISINRHNYLHKRNVKIQSKAKSNNLYFSLKTSTTLFPMSVHREDNYLKNQNVQLLSTKTIMTKNNLHLTFKSSKTIIAPTTSVFSDKKWKIQNSTKPISASKRSKREIGVQKCKIPIFDALHPQIKPYVNMDAKNARPLKRVGRIVNGTLELKLSNAQRAGFYYLRRFKDYNSKLSDWHNLMSNKKDIDVSVPLKEEFVRLEFTQNNQTHTEFLSHVIKNHLKYDVTKRGSDDELNIVMVMFDSQSHKNVERQLRKTYDYLKVNPYTVILDNHVITGDGTTANLAPMFTGEHLTDLPEARGRINGSKYLDQWPLIFREFQKNGFITLLGDDDPRWGCFQFRLNGFREQPTDKYLLPFQFASKSDEMYDQSHQYAFEYLKEFAKTYTTHKHFSFNSLGMLGHNYLDRIKLVDNDAHSLFRFFEDKKYRNNTAIFLFGDHGHRFSKLRQTIWGKLEERLPFMSMTFPPWFFKKYKEKTSLLKMNSHVLTSHFDIYQTLQHLLYPDTYKKSRGIGTSLFTNIAQLNRTCEEAGVPAHFCPCKEYHLVPINNYRVLKICNKAVSFINTILRNNAESKRKCSELKLKEIIRVRIIAPSEKMQKHDKTFDTKECDHCGLKEDKTFRMKVTQYEVVFSVEPSRGVYEATVEYLHDTRTIRVIPDISRVNQYGSQPNCIAKKYPHLRKYCFCMKKG